jgi:hypothetical protein
LSSLNVLLVEGDSDKSFFEACLRKASITGVVVSPPTDLGGEADGRGNALHLLPTLLKQLNDGQIRRLGIVVDADHLANGLGHDEAYSVATEKLAEYGYAIPRAYPSGRPKYVFDHPDGLPRVGVWIMPDNSSDGMLEDFVAEADKSAADQAQLFINAQKAVRALAPPRFDPTRHLNRASTYTWLAWQSVPGKQIASVIGDGLIRLDVGSPSRLLDWLGSVFP